MKGPHILAVRLGAMGDVIHTLPAIASLKHSLPNSCVSWIVEPRWMPLLQGNECIDSLIPFDRGTLKSLHSAWVELRAQKFDFVIDFQGLIKSALVASCARAERIYGFDVHAARESTASWFYSHRVSLRGYHAVERNLDLAAAAGADVLLKTFPLPQGLLEGELPEEPFVLANPTAGWGAKQWPLEHYSELGALIRRETGMPLVLNAPAAIQLPNTVPNVSGLSGLIYATRRAAAVIGLDSGPMHLAAALGRPGVAIYGPTEPARHGPYSSHIRVLRSSTAATTYRRDSKPHSSMHEIRPAQVLQELAKVLQPALRA